MNAETGRYLGIQREFDDKINGNLAYFLERKYAVIFAYGK